MGRTDVLARLRTAACLAAAWYATKPPRLDPMSATGPGGSAARASSSWPSIRVTVTCSKSGSLKSGQCSSSPCARRRSAKNAALVDVGDDAKPCR